jgi:hypothetical protein
VYLIFKENMARSEDDLQRISSQEGEQFEHRLPNQADKPFCILQLLNLFSAEVGKLLRVSLLGDPCHIQEGLSAYMGRENHHQLSLVNKDTRSSPCRPVWKTQSHDMTFQFTCSCIMKSVSF